MPTAIISTGENASTIMPNTSSSGTIAGRLLFDNPDGLLLPGQNVILRGHTIEPVEAPVIPQRAVLQDQQGHYVMTVLDDGSVAKVGFITPMSCNFCADCNRVRLAADGA